jgi:hypothetical protein
MFYQCTKYQFNLSRSDLASGGIIASSALPRMQLLARQRKLVKTYPHLAHRMLDPQLYLAGIPATSKAVPNLATYPWFGVPNNDFDSSQQRLNVWMDANEQQMRTDWPGKVPTDEAAIRQIVKSCIDLQLKFGVEAIIIPSPLTTIQSQQYDVETRYLDAAAEYCKSVAIQIPVFATVAFSDQAVRGTDPTSNPLVSTIAAQIASRDFVDGAYLIIEQSNDHGHCYGCEEGCLSLLLLADDLTRGGGKRVIANYSGIFGAISMAAGTSIWSSGHYRSHRRFRLADQEDERGSAMPRLYSLGLLGDVGVDENAALIYKSQYRDHVLYGTGESRLLYAAFAAGFSSSAVPEWRYVQGNISAASAHYYQVCKDVDDLISAHDLPARIKLIEKALERAAKLALGLKSLKGLQLGAHTDLIHQEVWLNAFVKWRRYAKL